MSLLRNPWVVPRWRPRSRWPSGTGRSSCPRSARNVRRRPPMATRPPCLRRLPTGTGSRAGRSTSPGSPRGWPSRRSAARRASHSPRSRCRSAPCPWRGLGSARAAPSARSARCWRPSEPPRSGFARASRSPGCCRSSPPSPAASQAAPSARSRGGNRWARTSRAPSSACSSGPGSWRFGCSASRSSCMPPRAATSPPPRTGSPVR